MTLEEKVIQESNRYFERNKNAITDKNEASKNAYIAKSFIEKYIASFPNTISKVLEIGCNYGYNLNFISQELNIECHGIEPSDKAVEYGNQRWSENNSKVHLTQGISNKLPYHDDEFDVVLIGFSLYVTPREMIADSILEINRVLRQGGFIILTDFDTPIMCRRVNEHNAEMPVFKENYANRFLPIGYSLAEKTSYSHSGDTFNPDIQERVSTQSLYKEICQELYLQA